MTVDFSPTAVILAAGLGTRLRPLSYQVPKPLFPIINRPLLGLILAQLHAAGFRRVAINTHHRADEIKAFLEANTPIELEIYLSYEPVILGTAGGIRQLAGFLGETPFLVINGDIVTDLDLAATYQAHHPEALATLVLHDYPRFNNVWLSQSDRIAAFGPARLPMSTAPPLAFTGVQVISPRLFNYIAPGLFVNIIDVYRQAMAAGEAVAAHREEGFYWQDIGTPQDYLEIHRRLLAGELPVLANFLPPLTDPFLDAGAVLGPRVCCDGGVCLGAGVRVGEEAYLKNTVLWADTIVDPGVRLVDCLVGRGVRVRESAVTRTLTGGPEPS